MGKRYDREFKIEVVRLASEPGNTQAQVEQNLGIGQGMISRWKRQLKFDSEHVFPGKGNQKPQDEELRRQKRENDRLRRERNILKKPWPSSRRNQTDIRVHRRAPHAVAC